MVRRQPAELRQLAPARAQQLRGRGELRRDRAKRTLERHEVRLRAVLRVQEEGND